MKILLVGANGTIGKAVSAELEARHEIIAVGRTSGRYQADITDIDSLKALFDKVGRVDAVISAAGNLPFAPLSEFTPELYKQGWQDKLQGQINLVLAGSDYVDDGGSFTLTSGILSEVPIRFGSAASAVNAALEGFARAAAIELPRGQRINVVSPTVLTESLPDYGPYFRGFESVPAARVALAYSRSAEGAQTGQVFKVQ
ncbi:short chain dehydrogenase [Crenobacter cavernae]|uniref:Short chain dehydrogenase n=1 Tax=Crenobacter cavernae TaxID=2290923 RepID=A0ABY0F9J7_9NEIS|nr:short chain dehydrogenase [Crenobacter cavernae]RXZ42148.1 short chain dehydrogenase [Crenobacter cavernae]